jgi:RNA polymerase sigma factor (sigma-70 family)
LKEDREIWEKLKAGDKTALSIIYFGHFNPMFGYGIKIKDDPEFIKDCIQDVFFNLIRAGKKLGSTDNIRFYLLKALKNTILKGVEKDQKLASAKSELKDFTVAFQLEDDANKHDYNDENELAKALKGLSDKQREIIYLRYDCNMDYKQISEIMQIKNNSARKLVVRALKALRDALSDKVQSSILFLMTLSRKCVF